MHRTDKSTALTEASLRSFFEGRMSDFPIYVHEIIDSTNTEAKRLAASGESDCLIAAVHQTAVRWLQRLSRTVI